ncbi:hypothetical protein [Oscillatoria acuminata]|uniref:Uncharacterized protein n=1 Tax=Oscillatoria acuminata PCC 6304 TaxID=56110 RepID=K9TTG8_9CYAN|nr:hypothetical protein [Oscillatoria acuminata]AFY85476.1 hypothetical protein Oscil6304_6016 [Oscillatoria acuminata PCC 6304]
MPELTEQESAIIQALAVHPRLPRTIIRAIEEKYPVVLDPADVAIALQSLESKGIIHRHCTIKGRITDAYELPQNTPSE